jgi:molybdenum-dependent DNA-binding transcriptional regulator ModE
MVGDASNTESIFLAIGKGRGGAGGVASLRAELESLRQERDQLEAEVNRFTEQLAAEERSHESINHEAVRDRILASLKLGKQAPQYKAAARAIDEFIKEISGRHP